MRNSPPIDDNTPTKWHSKGSGLAKGGCRGGMQLPAHSLCPRQDWNPKER